MTPEAAGLEANKELVRRFVDEVIDGENFDRIDEFVSEDFVGHNPATPDDIRGPEGVREFLTTFGAGFSDVEHVQEDVLAEDDFVVQRSRLTGVHDGEFMGVEPAGNGIDVASIVLYRIEDGLIAEQWVQSDVTGMMEQLGVQ